MNPRPTRRWFRFSLRTMLALVTVVCIYLGWAMNWIRQRRVFAKSQVGIFVLQKERTDGTAPLAPYGLWILGEKGIGEIYPNNQNSEREAVELFPEAVVRWDYPEHLLRHIELFAEVLKPATQD